MTKIYVKFFDNENNIVMLPVSTDDPVPPVGFKPAESYQAAARRNANPRRQRKLIGSVRLI